MESKKEETKDRDYTPGETKFADGKGTTLDKDTKAPNGQSNEEKEKKSGTSEGDADYENPNDDPA